MMASDERVLAWFKLLLGVVFSLGSLVQLVRFFAGAEIHTRMTKGSLLVLVGADAAIFHFFLLGVGIYLIYSSYMRILSAQR